MGITPDSKNPFIEVPHQEVSQGNKSCRGNYSPP